MPKILMELAKALDNDDLFEIWQSELSLRASARASVLDDHSISISNTRELEFFYRCWYFSKRKSDFFNLLLDSLHNMEVLKWLGDRPAFLLQDFWSFLPWHIVLKTPPPEKLQFIVNLYNSEYHAEMIQVINSLNLDSCQFLQSRTANPELRNLFKERESELIKNRKQSLYDFEKSPKSEAYPGLYGDKTENILQALDLLEKGSIHNYQDPYCKERFTVLLTAAEAIFQSAMIEDCLLVLLDIYEDYKKKNRLVSLLDDEKIHRTFFRLLRQVIPLQAILTQPLTPYAWADRIYSEYFPLINRDPASLQYLAVYESIINASQKQNPHIIYEIYMRTTSLLNNYHPFDSHLLATGELNNGLDPQHLKKLMQIIAQKISALPHESLVLMEFIRMCSLIEVISLNKQIAAELLELYINLWNWLPCSTFMNETIYSHLAPLVGGKGRYQARQICEAMIQNSHSRLLEEISSRPDLFRSKDAVLKRQILAAHFLGVLK